MIFLYDGKCPFCLREKRFLEKRNNSQMIKFVDITQKNYNPKLYQNISYEKAMSNLHGIINGNQIILGLDVLRNAYEIVGLGWIYYPLEIKLISDIMRFIYKYWARYRLKITGRSESERFCGYNCDLLN